MAKKNVKENEQMNLPEVVEAQKELATAYKKDCSLIKRELGKVESSFLNIGFSLHRIYVSGSYKLDGYNTIYDFGKDKFNLARGTVSNFINVVETFGKRNGNTFLDELDDKYKAFSSSQLIALLGYINRGGNELDCFTSDMSVREIKKAIKEKEASASDTAESEYEQEVIDTDTSNEIRNVLIQCIGKEDYDKKVDDIDFLILNMFAKSKKRVRIEIVAVEY